jgi:hypothetical protein
MGASNSWLLLAPMILVKENELQERMSGLWHSAALSSTYESTSASEVFPEISPRTKVRARSRLTRT